MNGFLRAVMRLDLTFHVISGSMLLFIMAVTLLDVIMRNMGRPIVGTIEIISFSGSIVVGFAIPYTSWKKAHIYVDFLVGKLSPRNKLIFNIVTRCMGIVLFAFIGFNFIIYGLDLKRTQEVSPSFNLPYYPIPFGLSLSCFTQCLTLIADLVKTITDGGNK